MSRYGYQEPNTWFKPNSSDPNSGSVMIRVDDKNLYETKIGFDNKEYLPNIKGRLEKVCAERGESSEGWSGAIYRSTYKGKTDSGNGEDTCLHMTFDASKSNSIYSDTVPHVRPKAYNLFMWERTA